MDVRVIPNRFRPGVGRYPAQENRRALLPQHARMLPPVEEANRLGVLLYPPLHDHESVRIESLGNGAMRVSWFTNVEAGQRAVAFVATVHRSGGPGGIDATDVAIVEPACGYTEQQALDLIASVTSAPNSPPGTVGLRGAHNLMTEPGWDTVFLPVLNEPQRPAVATLALRVETDWFPFETEFRVLLEKGDVVSMIGSGPIGQAIFVPRERPALVPCGPEEQAAFTERHERFAIESTRARKVTRYGGAYADLYAVERERRRAAPAAPAGGVPRRAGDGG